MIVSPAFSIVRVFGSILYGVPVSYTQASQPRDSPARIRIAPVGVAILCSRENPKILWVDDAEVVGDLIAVDIPVPGHVVAQEGQDRDAEILEAGVALVVGDVFVRQPP